MFSSLRTRLALSHTLPVLLFVALLGFALLYQLERYYFLDNLAAELAAQGTIIATFTREQPQLLRDPALAQFALDQLQERIRAQLMLVDTSGRVIAATWFGEPYAVGTAIDSRVVATALRGQASWATNFSVGLQEQVLDVAVPVIGARGSVVGVVRLSHSLEEVQRRLEPLRTLVFATLGIGALLSLVLGLILAQSVATPLQRLATAVSGFSPTAPLQPVAEQGPREIRTLAAAFNRMSTSLHELERSRQALLVGIVHELGRPLGAIKAAAQTIRNSRDPDLAVELATGIDDQVDQMQLQVEDLALLGEMELQGLQMSYAPLDVGELLEHQCRQFDQTAQDRGITLTCTLPPDLPLLVGDAKRIGQMVDNLIHNALKYTPSGGAVEVTARPDPSSAPTHIEIQVCDNGPGITAGEEERIFQFFYRSPAQQRLHQGMGIGLALARQLAERHNGTLLVSNHAGDGATFTLRLPLRLPLQVPPQIPPQIPPQVPLQTSDQSH